jgi:single-strand selective monofunctional uracil DNA glycosylase
VVGVGAFAEARARAVLGDAVRIGRIPHPSPASPAANRGWEKLADEAFAGLGIAVP